MGTDMHMHMDTDADTDTDTDSDTYFKASPLPPAPPVNIQLLTD